MLIERKKGSEQEKTIERVNSKKGQQAKEGNRFGKIKQTNQM